MTPSSVLCGSHLLRVLPTYQLFLPPLPTHDPPLLLRNYHSSSSSLQGSHCTGRGCNTSPGSLSPRSEHLHPDPACRVGCFAPALALRRMLAAGKAAQERGQSSVTSCGSGDICLGRGSGTRPKATTEATSASPPPPHHLSQGQPGSALSQGWGLPLQTPPGWRLPSVPGGPRGSARPPECSWAGGWHLAALLLSAGAAARHWHINTPSWKDPVVYRRAAHGHEETCSVPSHPAGAGSPGMPCVSASPVINKGGMWWFWPPGSARLLHQRGKMRALEMLAPLPLSRLPLRHRQPAGDSEGVQSCLLAPVPARPRGGG